MRYERDEFWDRNERRFWDRKKLKSKIKNERFDMGEEIGVIYEGREFWKGNKERFWERSMLKSWKERVGMGGENGVRYERGILREKW